ncbi:MAG: hypothetical protein RJA59_1273 [Pseudomonadota bacterium]
MIDAIRDHYRTLHHEAGHALAVHLYGWQGIGVAVTPEAARRLGLSGAGGVRALIDARHWDRSVIFSLIGIAAERHHTREPAPSWVELMALAEQGDGDAACAVKDLAHVPHWFPHLWSESSALVERHWPAVEQLVDALIWWAGDEEVPMPWAQVAAVLTEGGASSGPSTAGDPKRVETVN